MTKFKLVFSALALLSATPIVSAAGFSFSQTAQTPHAPGRAAAAARMNDDDKSTLLRPGVSRELARHRAAHYRDARYRLAVELLPGAETLKGSLEVRVTTTPGAGDIILDWRKPPAGDGRTRSRVWDVEVNGRSVAEGAWRETNEHLVISQSLLAPAGGEQTVRLKFESPVSATGGAAVTRYRDREDGAEYFYTLFVPSDASTAFPCFDQPDLKARFQLDITTPARWTVVSNTVPASSILGENTGDLSTAVRTLIFQETPPISTYVFAFAAGPFEVLQDSSSPLGTKLYVRKSQAERARKESAEVFRLNREGVAFFERYFARKFPFQKYDLVLIPEFPFRGMEHAGATFLREETIVFPSDPTANDLWSRADVLLHEAAHQWFGDLVTMRWFDDLWLKEGFATFMASKAIDELLPQIDAWKTFYLRTKPLAYDTDATKGTTPIWQEIPNLSAAKSAYGNIVYRKAPSMLRQAEFYLGPTEFQQAVRDFLNKHAFANAEWADLVRAFEQSSGRKLDAWAEAWVRRRGMPDVRVSWEADETGRIKDFTLAQADVLAEGGAWPMRVKVLLAPEGGAPPDVLTVSLDGKTNPARVREAVGKARPAFVFANYEDHGYGRFLLDDKSRAHVLQNLGAIEDDFLRALLWGSLWDSVREAELAPLAFVEMAARHVARERDEVAAQFVLARVETAFNRYLSDEQRAAVAPAVERVLRERMLGAETAGLRITYFRAFRQIASTPAGLGTLRDILAGRLSVPGMTLRARDRFDLLAALLAAGDREAPALRASMARDVKNDDERRYAYAAGAAEPTAVAKQKYFEAFLRDPNLAESWIEASVNPFNYPRHAALTLPHLASALGALPEHKRTRKIFFVNNWLAAFLGGQCDASAVKTVRDFLAREASLDRDLRLKVLEAADGLERCARIRAKYATAVGR